jgi:hypothetical protein
MASHSWKNWDFSLFILTIFALLILGLISLGGAFYSWWLSMQNPNWTSSLRYLNYLETMNWLAAPFAIALAVLIAFCIPRRIFTPQPLLIVVGVMGLVSLATGITISLKVGIGLLLIGASLLDVSLLFFIFANPQRLRFERTGTLVQVGSALLHLGFIIILIDIALLQKSPYHISIFWFATILAVLGTALSFFASEISQLIKK